MCLRDSYKDGKEVAGAAKYWNIKGEPVDTLEDMALEVKEEVKSKEPVAEAKPELDGVNAEELDRRGKFPNFIYFSKGSDTPYTGKVYELHPNGQKGYEGKYKVGLQEGLIVMWYESGQKFREENYIDGEKEGLWGEWYPDGQKSWEASYKDGKVNGIWTRWHENGQKATEENYKDDELISAKYWNTKGELKK